MECKTIKELQEEGLPSTMPSSTEIGVWKRSTGYEVILPYRLGSLNWLLLGLGLIFLVGSAFMVMRSFTVSSPTGQAVFYTILVVPVLAYMLFLSFKLSQTRTTKIRIDMTPLSMVFTLVEPSGVTKRFSEIPISQIENVCLDAQRGIRINGHIAGTHFGIWTGRGLNSEDLYYLTCVIGQVTLLTVQNSGAVVPAIKGMDDVGHIELG